MNQTYHFITSSVPLPLLMFRYVRTAWTPSTCHPGGFWDGGCEDYAEGLGEEYVHQEALQIDQEICLRIGSDKSDFCPVDLLSWSNRSRALSNRSRAWSNRSRAWSNRSRAWSILSRTWSNRLRTLSNRSSTSSNRSNTSSNRSSTSSNRSSTWSIRSSTWSNRSSTWSIISRTWSNRPSISSYRSRTWSNISNTSSNRSRNWSNRSTTCCSKINVKLSNIKTFGKPIYIFQCLKRLNSMWIQQNIGYEVVIDVFYKLFESMV